MDDKKSTSRMTALIKTIEELVADTDIRQLDTGTLCHTRDGFMAVEKQRELCGKVVFCYKPVNGDRIQNILHTKRTSGSIKRWLVHDWMIKEILVE